MVQIDSLFFGNIGKVFCDLCFCLFDVDIFGNGKCGVGRNVECVVEVYIICFLCCIEVVYVVDRYLVVWMFGVGVFEYIGYE